MYLVLLDALKTPDFVLLAKHGLTLRLLLGAAAVQVLAAELSAVHGIDRLRRLGRVVEVDETEPASGTRRQCDKKVDISVRARSTAPHHAVK